MSYAFAGVINSKWNEEVVEYLASKFNSVNPRFIVLSKTVFINATLAKFDNASFVINAQNDCLELSFAKVDTDKMEPVIREILNWCAFTKYPSRFYVKVDKDTSRSFLFECGRRQCQTPQAFKRRFHAYETEIILIENK